MHELECIDLSNFIGISAVELCKILTTLHSKIKHLNISGNPDITNSVIKCITTQKVQLEFFGFTVESHIDDALFAERLEQMMTTIEQSLKTIEYQDLSCEVFTEVRLTVWRNLFQDVLFLEIESQSTDN